MQDTVTVQLAGQTVQYRAEIAEFGTFLANGGKVVSLSTAFEQAKAFFRANHSPIIKSVTFWVTFDDSGLAYLVDVNRRGQHFTKAASPLPGPNNVKDVYVA